MVKMFYQNWQHENCLPVSILEISMLKTSRGLVARWNRWKSWWNSPKIKITWWKYEIHLVPVFPEKMKFSRVFVLFEQIFAVDYCWFYFVWQWNILQKNTVLGDYGTKISVWNLGKNKNWSVYIKWPCYKGQYYFLLKMILDNINIHAIIGVRTRVPG